MNLPKIIEKTENTLQNFVETESEEDINRLLQNLQGQKATSTQKTYRYALVNFCKFFLSENKISIEGSVDDNVSQIMSTFLNLSKIKGLTLVSNYISYLRGEYPSNGLKVKPQSTSTIYTKLIVLKTYVRQTRAINELLPGVKQDWNLDDLKAHKVEHKKVPGPSENQFSKLLEYFSNLESSKSSSYIDLRNCLLFFILSFTGLRISGALSIDIDDIDFENDRIKVLLKGRGNQKIEMSVAKLIMNKIMNFLVFDGRVTGPLFINKDQIKESTSGNRLRRESAFRIIKSLCQKAGVDGIHPHKFRHFLASEALEAADGDVNKAKEVTTHESSKIFMSYVDKRNNDQKIIADKIADNWLDKFKKTKGMSKTTESKD